jgi:hypothetical protein
MHPCRETSEHLAALVSREANDEHASLGRCKQLPLHNPGIARRVAPIMSDPLVTSSMTALRPWVRCAASVLQQQRGVLHSQT